MFVEANNKISLYNFKIRFKISTFFFLFLSPFYMETYPNLVSVLNFTSDKFSSNCSVNDSRFPKLYGTTCNSVVAKNQPRLRGASKPLWRANKPLRRANKPLRRASKPLRRASEPLRRSNQSLRRSNQSLRKSKQSLRRSKQSLRRSKQSLRRSKQSLRRSKQSLRRSCQSLRRSKQSLRRSKQSLRRSKQSLRRSKQSLRRSNQSLWISNQSLERTQNNPQEKNGYQPSTKHAVSHNESINYKMSHKRARHSIGTCINSDDCAHQCRLSARQLTKQPHVKRIRDRVNLLDCL